MNLDRDTDHLLWRVSELPWKMKVEHKPEYSLMSVEANDGSVIAEFDCCDDQWSNEAGFANAGLIAAAPRLYDCLYKLYKDYILPFGFDSLKNLPSELVDKTVEALNMAVGHGNDKDVPILPCPFCGNKDVRIGMITDNSDGYTITPQIFCSKCGATQSLESGKVPEMGRVITDKQKRELIAKWNNRDAQSLIESKCDKDERGMTCDECVNNNCPLMG